MTDRIQAGAWVQIHQVVLTPAERAPGIPEETAGVPYEYWVSGFLAAAAAPGEQATVKTPAGRSLTGTLVAHPGYTHSFGPPHRALLAVGPSLRRLLAEGGKD